MNRQRTGGSHIALGLGLFAAASFTWANNLQITNVAVSGRDNSTAFVSFDISWENSWRFTNINHDAAWVFFKVLADGRTEWEPVLLEGTGINPTGYSTGSGTSIEIIVPPDRVGLWIRRATEGAGTTAVQNVRAVWNFASNSLAKSDRVKLQAFGVEMVYVAEGPFKVGSGGGGVSELYTYPNPNQPYVISNEAAIIVGTNTGNLYYASSSYGGDRQGPIPDDFPKGYAAFYCMKYEITQGQYADFLNTLTRAQQEARCTATTLNYYMSDTAGGSAAIQSRNTVRLTEDPGSPYPRVYTTARRDRACGHLSYHDGLAFADWAGLRPMTELEFEKACRGPLDPVPNEYAWGTSTIMGTSRTLSGQENGTETIMTDTSSGGCNYGGTAHSGGDGGYGPLRVGIFATPTSSRVSAGASYWGIMELSGNLYELTVSIGNSTARGFTGAHGDGRLSVAGASNVTGWPDGIAFRGGCFPNHVSECRVSNRVYGSMITSVRHAAYGFRAVRTAPGGVGR